MKIKVAKYIAQFLVNNNILDCFMVTGGGAMHLDDAIGHQSEINCIFNHHEQACAIAAEAYARMTGRLAAVCVTSGPGGTNAITGVLGGWLDSIPMFILSGQVKRETTKWRCPDLKLRQLGDQEYDIVKSVDNMTKYSVMIIDPLEIAYHLEKALFLSKTGRGGPVWIDIPFDVQGAIIDTGKLKHFIPDAEVSATKVSVETINMVLNKIAAAKAPLLLAGTAIRLSDSEDVFLKLVHKLQIPVVTAWNANDTLATDNPYYAGMPGTVGTRAGNFAVQNCDLIIVLGCRLNIRMIGYNHFDFAKNAYKIIIDIDSNELLKPTIKPDMPICCNVKDFISALLSVNYKIPRHHQKWVSWCHHVLSKYPVVLEEYHNLSDGKLNPYVFLDVLFDNLQVDDRIICGNGSACVMTFQAAKIKQGQRVFTNSGCASMGYGLPAALGVAVSDNSRRTICIDGDGSIMMNIQELATVFYNRLNIKIFILNNNGYHSIRQTQKNLFKPPHIGIDGNSGLAFPNFGILAQAFSLPYYKILSENDCKNVQEVLCCDGPCICEVVVDESQNFTPKSSSKILPDGRIVSPSINDMAPFLDRDDFESNIYQLQEIE